MLQPNVEYLECTTKNGVIEEYITVNNILEQWFLTGVPQTCYKRSAKL